MKFLAIPVSISVSKQMQLLKASSSKWINDNKFVRGKFSWQEGYGAFFLFSFTTQQGNSVYNESGRTPPNENLSRRILGITQEV
jgi:putative transposase